MTPEPLVEGMWKCEACAYYEAEKPKCDSNSNGGSQKPTQMGSLKFTSGFAAQISVTGMAPSQSLSPRELCALAEILSTAR